MFVLDSFEDQILQSKIICLRLFKRGFQYLNFLYVAVYLKKLWNEYLISDGAQVTYKHFLAVNRYLNLMTVYLLISESLISLFSCFLTLEPYKSFAVSLPNVPFKLNELLLPLMVIFGLFDWWDL